jgi:RNA polymerase sigma-70 factor, ECF subfamily
MSLPLSDAPLVAQLRAHDRVALRSLFDRYGVHVRRILLHILGTEPDIPDLLHDVFIIAFENIDDLENPEALKAWLSGIAVRTARSFIRRRMRWWRWPSKKPSTVSPQPMAGPDVSAALRSAYAILDALPPDERVVFSLRHMEGLQFEEIAQLCGASLATIRRRMRRAELQFEKRAALDPLLLAWRS